MGPSFVRVVGESHDLFVDLLRCIHFEFLQPFQLVAAYRLSTLIGGARVHVEHLPNMAVEVLKAVSVHEAVVLGFGISLAAAATAFETRLSTWPGFSQDSATNTSVLFAASAIALGANCLNLGWVRSMT